MKVFLTGVSGQLGYDVAKTLDAREIDYVGVSSKELDICDRGAVMTALADYAPDVVIHCAAYTKVDLAEDEPEKCWNVNVDGTRNIAEACRQLGAKMVYISTDYVFPGEGDEPYEVDDPVRPLNTYGRAKLAGELVVQSFLEKYFIVRTSWVIGQHGSNFVKTMLKLAETHREVTVVDDQIGSPTFTMDLAPLLCDMIMTEKYGVYHATNEGYCSWAELACAVFKAADTDISVLPVTTAEYGKSKAERPYNSRLSKRKLVENSFNSMIDWHDTLTIYLNKAWRNVHP